MKKKSIFYTTSYLRSISMILGSSVVLVIILIQMIKQENYYSKIEGEITVSHLRWKAKPYDIVLNTSEHGWYTYISKYFPVLKEKAIVGKKATIWYDREHKIKKLIIEDEVVIPYYQSTWINVFFIGLAGFMLIGNIIYIIQNPNHLVGKKE